MIFRIIAILIIGGVCSACWQAKTALARNNEVKTQVKSKPESSQNNDPLYRANAPKRRIARQFAARLREDILWNNVSKDFHFPDGDLAQIAVYQKGKLVWICSRELNICEQFDMDCRDIRTSLSRKTYDQNEPDIENAVRKFASAPPLKKMQTLPLAPVASGVSVAVGEFESLWTTKIQIGKREAIIKQHKEMRPAELAGLREQLLEELKDAGYRSITIACFDPAEDSVRIYGDRPPERGGPIIFSERWDLEQEAWIYVSLLEEQRSPEIFRAQKAILLSIACETVKFN